MEQLVRLPQGRRDAHLRAESFNADANTIEVIWTTGAAVRRYSWFDGEEYDETLSLEPGAVRLDRLNAGAPFVDTHSTFSLDNVIGSVVPGSAKVEDGRGVATVLLSKAPGVADTVQKIREGVIRNISVGYWQHKVVKTESDDTRVARWDVVDWEPLEISAVPVPADAGSQIRSEGGDDGAKLRSCVLVTRTPATGPNATAKEETPMADRKNAKTDDTEEKRLAALRASKRDDESETAKDKDADDDRDEDDKDSDDERDADEDDKKSDDERDGDGDDDDDSEDEDKKDDGTRSAGVDARRVAREAVAAERARITSIGEIAERAGLPKLGQRHIGKGTSVRQFRELVLEKLIERQGKASIAATGAEGLTKERGTPKGRSAEVREYEEGEAHWRAVAGKPAPAGK